MSKHFISRPEHQVSKVIVAVAFVKEVLTWLALVLGIPASIMTIATILGGCLML